jgi:hypothetical protein
LVSKFPELQAGCDEVSLSFKFVGSCPGGVNRRETAVIFTLKTLYELE